MSRPDPRTNQAIWRTLWRQRHGGVLRCSFCSATEEETRAPFEIDHMIELQDGGLDVEWNTQPLCRDCHRLKGRMRAFRLNVIPAGRAEETPGPNPPGPDLGAIDWSAIWPRVLSSVEKRNAPTWGFLESSVPRQQRGHVLTIAVPTIMRVRMLSDEPHRTHIVEVVREHVKDVDDVEFQVAA